MKKQYRDITINGVKFAWAYDNRGMGSDSYIRIWKDKKLLMENRIKYGYGNISPKIVSNMIEAYYKNNVYIQPIQSKDKELTK